MTSSSPILIWASKPGCSRPVAEVWINNYELWFVIFIDDNDGKLKFELLPRSDNTATWLLDFSEVEQLIATAKLELMTMGTDSN